MTELRELASFQKLYQEYTQKHVDAYISQEEFEAFVLSAPMFIVANADGHLASAEIAAITENILKMYSDDNYEDIAEENTEDSGEFNYFTRDFDLWKDKLLEVHKEYIGQDVEKQKATLMLMESVANAHHEDTTLAVQTVLDDHAKYEVYQQSPAQSLKNISAIEKQAILDVAKQLGLDQNAELNDYLQKFKN